MINVFSTAWPPASRFTQQRLQKIYQNSSYQATSDAAISVDNAQVGFVPGRNIAIALDIFAAAKIAVKNEEAMKDAIVLLLDFSKAYDTLQRHFLLAVLKLLGFPNTTCSFLVNGFLSWRVEINCGITQGCSMAPLLFIFALDSTYKVLRICLDIHGVWITATGMA